MDPHDPQRLADEWHHNERILRQLTDLPAGPVDPAERERQIDARQDEIEGATAEEWYRRRREEEPG